MWIRKCDLDAQAEAPSPIPTQLVSNEEFIPEPQTLQQKQFEERLIDISTRNARKLGFTRRHFMRTGAGMAAAMQCLAAPAAWPQLRGRLATVSATGEVVAGDDALLVTFAANRDWSPGHVRRLLAGWFALNPFAYIGATLLAAGWLGAATLVVVKRSGRPQG